MYPVTPTRKVQFRLDWDLREFLAWTVPIQVTIGRNPCLAQVLQTLVPIAASFPATALFPVWLLSLPQIAGVLQIVSIVLMTLETIWYVLFNVIADAQSIPSDLFEAARVYKLFRWQYWQTVILLGILPYLITGIITAFGGARTRPILSANIFSFKVRWKRLSVWVQRILKRQQRGIFPDVWQPLPLSFRDGGAYQSFSLASRLSLGARKLSITCLKDYR